MTMMDDSFLVMFLTAYAVATVGVAHYAARKNRSWIRWAFVAWFFSPLIAGIFLRDMPAIKRK